MRGTRKTRKKTRKVFGGDTNVLSLDNLLNNKNKNLYPIEENEHINIDIVVCKDKKDKTQTHYKIFKIEKTENDSAIPRDNKDRKNLPLTSGYTLDLQLNEIIKKYTTEFHTKYIRVMLVLYDNKGSKELRIFKVTAINKIKSSISDQCTRGMHVYTKKNNTNTVKIPTNTTEESKSVKISTNTSENVEPEEESKPEEESEPIIPDKTADAKLDIDDAKLTFVLNALNNILDKDNTNVNLEDTVVDLFETFTDEFGEDTNNQENLQNILECIKHNWPDDRVDQIERLEEERDCIKIIQIMRKIDNFNISRSKLELIPIHKILTEITTIIGDQYTKIQTLLKVGITNTQLLQVNKELQDHLNTKNLCANETTYEESKSTKELETAVEKNVQTLAIIGFVKIIITNIRDKLNEIHKKERINSSTELNAIVTDIKSLDQQLNSNKEKLKNSTQATNAELKHPTYTIDNIQKVLKNYQDRLKHVGFMERIKMKETNFKDKVMDGIFIFTNLYYYFSGNLDAILHDLGIGSKGTVDNTIYNYLEDKHVGGRVTHKNKRKLKKQKRRYTKRANRK
jgi:hypothetical protein